MKIVIVGAGKVGYTIAASLSKEDHDITVIDNNEAVIRHVSETLDVLCLKGSGTSLTLLREADVMHADLLIAAASSDEVNMICVLSAKRLGAAYTIARIRSVEYATELDTLKNELGIDLVINPEESTAAEISRLLRFPNAINVDTFYHDRTELISFRVQENDFICNKPLADQSSFFKNLPILFCTVERGDKIFIPKGSYIPLPGDTIYLIGEPYGLVKFFKKLGRFIPKIKTVMIVGGSRTAHYLTKTLQKMGMSVKIIEKDAALCRHIAEVLPEATVICGDGTDQDLLISEDIGGTDAFIALTDRDEDNLLISLYASEQGVPKVVCKANHDNYSGIAKAVGLDTLVSTKYITAEQILKTVRGLENTTGSVMTALYKIANDKAEAISFIANETTNNLHVPLKDLRIKKGIILALIIHNGEVIIPAGSSTIEKGDTVIVISSDETVLDLNDIFSSIKVKGGENL